MTSAELLEKLLISGIMGMLGQTARTIAGLKILNDWASQTDNTSRDLFVVQRLVISLIIGGVAGIATLFALGIDATVLTDTKTLLGLAAAGYAGTDFIEAFIRRLPGAETSAAATPAAAGIPPLATRLDVIGSDVAELRTLLTTAPPAAPASVTAGGLLDTVTPEMVKQMFPDTPLAPIRRNLPFVLDGLRKVALTDRRMLLMALATIRAETEGFVPLDEYVSRFNTRDTPFDLYEPGTEIGRRLGNTEPGDGPRFKGRGFIQLTGRDNYTRTGPEIGLDLVAHPDYANAPDTAGFILATFLKDHENRIRQALDQGDLREARRAVNGGSNGLSQFMDAYDRGDRILPRSTLVA